MRETGGRKRRAHGRVDAGPHPEEDPGAERGLRLRHDGVQAVDEGASQARGSARQTELLVIDDGGVERPSDRPDSLAGEKNSVRESIEVLRLLEARPEDHAVTGADLHRARHPGQETAAQRMAIGLDVLEHGLLLVRLRTRIVEHRGPDDDLVLRPRQGADRPGSTRQRSIGRSE